MFTVINKTTIRTWGIYQNLQWVFILLFIAKLSFVPGNQDNAIAPWTENPQYWQYKGEPVLLLGGSDHDNLFNHPDTGPDGLEAHLDVLASNNGNYVRNTMSSRDENNPWPYEKNENNLYDLSKWNEEYWQRFDNFLQMTSERDIIVQIEFWDGHDIQNRNGGDAAIERWNAHPLNPKNNINYTADETSLPDLWDRGYLEETHPALRTIPAENNDQIVLMYQRHFINEVMNRTLKYDHVLYTIQNESWASKEWSNYWASFAREKAAERSKRICISDMRFAPSVTPVLEYGFDFAEFSQSASGAERPANSHISQGHFYSIAEELAKLIDKQVPVNSVKQYGSDEIAWTVSSEEGVERVWRTIFAGQASVRFHRPPHGLGLSTRAQANIRSLRMVTDLIDIFNVLPHQEVNHLLSDRNDNEAYLMADPARAYAVFFTSVGREVTLNISGLESNARLRWLNPNTGEWLQEKMVEGDFVTLTKPDEGQWVVTITNN